MAALATVTDVEALAGRPLDASDAVVVPRLLDMASGLVRGYCRQQLDRVTNDTVTLSRAWEQDLILPERPVINVASVAIGGVPLTAGSWTWNAAGDLFRSFRFGSPDATDFYYDYGYGYGPVTVTYTHGYSPVPDDIVAIVAGAVSAQLYNPGGALREMIGSRLTIFGGDHAGGGMSLAPDQRGLLNRYRRRQRAAPIGSDQRFGRWPVYR